uniref:Uncharacterized LOC109990008 n=1 Tax=Labrus bergylta TaxID=56723 RepID=A0A3Q3EIM3_9LABR|nr:uncharacterized protein LOC109990008 [Labrus bergylta]XP_029134734.1 uncharacterized protein LOC109990008 [Labrus bergylta]
MDLSLLPSPASVYNRQGTEALFTVRSANSPSYSLTRRPGVRKPRGFSEEERKSAEEVAEAKSSQSGANGTVEEVDDKASCYQARSGNSSRVISQYEDKDPKMSTMLSHTGRVGNTITAFRIDRGKNIAPESRGRTEFRRNNLATRSKSLEWQTGERCPDRGQRADMFIWLTKRTGDIIQPDGGLDESAGVQGTKEGVRSSIQAYYNCAGTSNVVQEKSPVSHMSQTLDRTSKGRSLPSRLRSQSGPCSNVRPTSASSGSKGGQSILERIEKLYGSAGFGKTEESNPFMSNPKDTTKDFLIPAQPRSYDWTSGGTFPRCFSSGQTSSFIPVQSRNSFTCTQSDTVGSETISLTRIRESSSGGQWPGQIQGVKLGRGLKETGTMSLDRARSRNTLADQIRATRDAGEIAPLQSNTSKDQLRSGSLRDWSGSRERRLSGSTECRRVNHREEKGSSNLMYGVHKEKPKLKSVSIDEDVFESNPSKITIKTIERNKLPEGLSVKSAASVRNKINQFEALTQRSQGPVMGQILMPRRAFSVPTQISGAHDGVKKSGSDKAISGLRDKREELKVGGEKTEEKMKVARKKCGSERSLSVDESGLGLRRKERDERYLVQSEGKEADKADTSENSKKYARLKSSLEIPINKGDQRQRNNFYIDESDFSKLSSPEEASDRPTSLPLFNSSDTPDGLPKILSSIVTSPVSDEDRTPTNTPNHSPLLSPTTQTENSTPIAENERLSDLVQESKTPEADALHLHHHLGSSSHSNHPGLVSSDSNETFPKGKKQVLDLDAWVAGLSPTIKVWNDDEDDFEDDDESTQKDEDSNYDSDSGESSVTITSNMSQSDRRSFCVSLSDLCNFAGVDYESENDSDEWQSVGRRTASLSSDMSAFSYVSVMPADELDKLLEDVRSLGDSTLQDYNDVQVVVLHKDVGVGLGFSLAGGIDQNKPVTVHKVFHLGVAAKEGSICEGDQVLSINGTALSSYAHWEALRVLRRAKTRDLGVVVLRKGGMSNVSKEGAQTKSQEPTATQTTETGQLMCVRLEKNNRDLGFSLEGGVGSSQVDRPLTVQKIFQGGPVDKVCPGDEVVEIEGVSMGGMRRLEVWTLIRRLPPGPVDVVLRRPLKHLET